MSTGDPEFLAAVAEKQDLSNLQENLNRQQVKISALKELVRKSEAAHGRSTSSAQEKVKNIAQRLSNIKSKARSRQNLDCTLTDFKDEPIFEDSSFSSPVSSTQNIRSETPGSEKIQLLRRQVEESKIKMAERENSKREIEERVTQLKAKFDSAQQSLERSSELGRSMGDLSVLSSSSAKEKFKSAADLSFTPLNLDKEKIKFLENRVKILEKQLEKQKSIPAPESEVVTSLKHKVLDLEENLREKECIIQARTQAVSLMSESLSAKTASTVDSLEDTRLEMQKMQQKFIESESLLQEEILKLQNELKDTNMKMLNQEEVNDILETARFDLTLKNAELESKLEGVGKYTTKLDELNKINEMLQHKVSELEEQLAEKTVECNVLNANFSVLQEKLKSSAPKPLFSHTGDEEVENETRRLKEQLDETNKSMIKIKLKTKQLQKQVDRFQKMSDANKEVVKLTEVIQELQTKIAELEDEKGSLQLKLLSSEKDIVQVDDSELQEKIKVLETTCQNQTSAIQLLEEQKLELLTMNQKLETSLKEQTIEMEASSKIATKHLAEKAENKNIAQLHQITSGCEALEQENESLREELRKLEEEKHELQKKNEMYLTENVDLLDKVEKLSKSSSSAESIEIVERLTHQEKLEMEELNSKISAAQDEVAINRKEKTDAQAGIVMDVELSESSTQLREESSELMHRIELFNKERREVLEKMDNLSIQNQELLQKINELNTEKCSVEENLTRSRIEIVSLEEKLDEALEQVAELKKELNDTKSLKMDIVGEMNELSRTTLIQSGTTKGADAEIVEKCTDSLKQMQTELENYRKSNDKSTRLNASKKLAKEAKNVCLQFNDLLGKIKTHSSYDTAVDGGVQLSDFEATIAGLKAEVIASKKNVEEKDAEIAFLNTKIDSMLANFEGFQQENQLESLALQTVREELDSKLRTADEEIAILKTLVAEQKNQLIEIFTEHEIELNVKAIAIENYEKQIEQLSSELKKLQHDSLKHHDKLVSELKQEIKKLKNTLSASEKLLAAQSAELQNKQDTIEMLNSQIINLYKSMEDNGNKLIEKEDEISYLQDLLDSKKTEYDAISKENMQNKILAEKLLAELQVENNKHYAELLSSSQQRNHQLEERVTDLEKVNIELDSKIKEQVEKLKKFAANLKKKSNQCGELEANIKSLNSCITLAQADSDVQQKKINSLQKEIDELRASTVPRQQLYDIECEIIALKNERDKMHLTNQNIKEAMSLQAEIQKLKHKEIIVGNSISEALGLVNIIKQDMDFKDAELTTLQNEIKTSQREAQETSKMLERATEELKSKSLKFEKSKSIIKEKNREIQRLGAKLGEVQMDCSNLIEASYSTSLDENTEVLKLKEKHEKLELTYINERESLLQTISRLETLYNGIQAKFQENMGYIETIEVENNSHKEKIVKLENCIALFEERRLSFERQTNLLDEKLQKQSVAYEKSEDALLHRLNILLDHDDDLARKLKETQLENDTVVNQLEQIMIEFSEMQSKLARTEKELDILTNEKLNRFVAENESLQQQLKNTEADIGRQQNIYEGRLAQKHAEIDELENDLSIQLNNINQEKRKLQENLEKSLDLISELKDENVKLKESANSLEQSKSDLEREITWIRLQNENMAQDQYELQELRIQSMQDKMEIDNLKHQMDALIQSHEIELNAVREQMEELDSVRMQVGKNRTDDQALIENENKRLKEKLAEKEAAIEGYQRENLKLQMKSLTSGRDALEDPFSINTTINDTEVFGINIEETNTLREKVKALEIEIHKLNSIICEKDKQHNTTITGTQLVKNQLIGMEQARAKFDKQKHLHVDIGEVSTSRLFINTSSDISAAEVPVTVQNIDHLALGLEMKDKKKIEDLQRNVSDLEKYTNELENRLKNLTDLHENTLLHLEKQNVIVKELQDRIKFYEMDLDKQTTFNVIKSVEATIIASESAGEALPSLDLFLDTAKQPEQSMETNDEIDLSTLVPAQEKLIVPKKAYLLYPEHCSSLNNDGEEGWGCGNEEAVLEEKHQRDLLQAKLENSSKVSEYEERIDRLLIEKTRSDEKIIELQVKCGRLMKKLKGYKSRLDQFESEKSFRKSNSVDSSDLDIAIQEELKSQIQMLGERMEEMQKQNEKEKFEKENLQKKIDVLLSANERMTEMKERQDIEVRSLHMKVRELTKQLHEMQDWSEKDEVGARKDGDENMGSMSIHQNEILEKNLEAALKEVEDIRIDRDELQALLEDEKNTALISESRIKELKAKLSSLECKNQIKIVELETELQRQCAFATQKRSELESCKVMNEHEQLKLNDSETTIWQLSSQYDALKLEAEQLRKQIDSQNTENLKLSNENKRLIAECATYVKEVEELRAKLQLPDDMPNRDGQLEDIIIELTSQKQYKEAEILHLKQRVQDLMQEDQTQTLIQEIFGKNQELVNLRIQVQQLISEKQELEISLTEKNSELVRTSTDTNDELKEKLILLEKQIEELIEEKQHMNAELQVLNHHVMTNIDTEDKMKQMMLAADSKDIEIAELNRILANLKQEMLTSEENINKNKPTNDIELQMNELNKSWEQTVERKCSEIAEKWRQYMEQRETEFKETESNLNLEMEQLRAGILTGKRKFSDDVEAKGVENVNPEEINKIQTILEQQELEIVTLKEQLATRSAEYARLAARHDPYALSTSSNLFFDKTKIKQSSSAIVLSEQPNVVPKSELDLALYMLHQRDMRCEELTLELVNLLEERDTLQLKLSNSLRQIENIKQKTSYIESETESDHTTSNTNSPERSTGLKSNITSEVLKSDNLSTKISQIQTVGYAKDKRFREEREERQRQMEKIQQDVANIPSEAVSGLVGSDLSNTMQSPSNVLLDWLWGKSGGSQQS